MRFLNRFLMIVTVFLLLPVMAIPGISKEKKDVKKAVSLHIFTSTNLTGNLEPCG